MPTLVSSTIPLWSGLNNGQIRPDIRFPRFYSVGGSCYAGHNQDAVAAGAHRYRSRR